VKKAIFLTCFLIVASVTLFGFTMVVRTAIETRDFESSPDFIPLDVLTNYEEVLREHPIGNNQYVSIWRNIQESSANRNRLNRYVRTGNTTERTHEYFGYHFHIQTIHVFNSELLIVSDLTGISLVNINTSNNQVTLNQQNMLFFGIPQEIHVGTVTSIYSDHFRNVYLLPAAPLDSPALHFELIHYNGRIRPFFQRLVPRTSVPRRLDFHDSLMNQIPPPAEVLTPSPANLAIEGRWSIDRMNGRVFYVPYHDPVTRHEIRHTQLGDIDNPYFNPSDFEHRNWRNIRVAHGLGDTHPAYSERLFMDIQAGTLLYQFPNSIGPLQIAPARTHVKVLAYNAMLYEPGTSNLIPARPNISFNYALVLYRNQAFYVNRNRLIAIDFATRNLGYLPENSPYDGNNQFVGFSGRVLMNNTLIYSLPIQDQSFVIGRLTRNFAIEGYAPGPGLRINRRITIAVGGITFYEVRINHGNPASPMANGAFVGFVDTNLVQDAHLTPSRRAFTTNGRVRVLPQSMINEYGGLSIFYDSGGEIRFEDILESRERIEILGRLDRTQRFTQIRYFAFDRMHVGWVETEFIELNRVTAWQIIAIIALCASVVVAIIVIIRHIRIRRQRIQIPKSTS